MKDWIIFAILVLLFWGIAGIFAKLATQYIHPRSVFIYEAIGGIIVVTIVLALLRFRPEVHPLGIIFAILTGLTGMLGTLFFLYAMSKGKVSIVVTMTALYPLLTFILSFLVLKESVTLKQGIGIIFALLAMVLFAG